jgi:disulfide bond formation protein DsbB
MSYFYLTNLSLASFALILAYIIQFFGFPPCLLCYYQRFIYVGIIAITLLGFFKETKFLPFVVNSLLIGGLMLSLFQVAIEEGWILYQSLCTSNFQSVTSSLDLLQEIYNKDLVACDKPQIKILGLSLAALNAFYLVAMLSLNYILLYKDGSLIKRILDYVTRRR